MDSLQKDLESGLFDGQEGPCLSLYQPTHRHHPENQQDPIRFRNLVKGLKDSLLRKYPARQIEPLLDPFVALADDRAFWDHTHDGLAVLGSPRLFRVYQLKHRVRELAVVADAFHTKPLLRSLQNAGRYQILGLNRNEMMLFEGDSETLAEIEPAAGVPRTMTAALGEELTEPHQTVASYGGSGSGHSPMHHGHGDRKSETAIDDERFFRAVDSAVLEHHSRPSALPLILATLPEHQQLFRRISRNPFLLDSGIDVYPDAILLLDFGSVLARSSSLTSRPEPPGSLRSFVRQGLQIEVRRSSAKSPKRLWPDESPCCSSKPTAKFPAGSIPRPATSKQATWQTLRSVMCSQTWGC